MGTSASVDTDVVDALPPVDTDTVGVGDMNLPHPTDSEAQDKLEVVMDNLHRRGSGAAARDAFPDMCGPDVGMTDACVSIFTDDASGAVCDDDDATCRAGSQSTGNGKRGFPEEIVPFQYFYSPSLDHTFIVCAVDAVVGVCAGRVAHRVTDADIPDTWDVASAGCTMVDSYLGSDPRLVRTPN